MQGDNTDQTAREISSASFQLHNLVSDIDGYEAAHIDRNLSNAWGMVIGANSTFWIASSNKGMLMFYDKLGNSTRIPIRVEGKHDPTAGKPTAIVRNTSMSFDADGSGQAARLLIAGEDGTIAAYTSGEIAHTVIDRSEQGAVYTGIEIVPGPGGRDYLLAADFHNANIDVFDGQFHKLSTMHFVDPMMPHGYAPFNLKLIDNQLYVLFAKQEGPENEDAETGVGNGYIDVFGTNGLFVKRFASAGALNAPWGIAEYNGRIYVGNFGDGRINVFGKFGQFHGQLSNNGRPLSIDGLWAIGFTESGHLYYTAGPSSETHGVFGYLLRKSDNMTAASGDGLPDGKMQEPDCITCNPN